MKLQALIALGLLVVVSFVMLSQEPRDKPDKPNTDKKVEMLFVQSAKSASVSNGKLILRGISPTTIFFSDRPERIAGHMATDEMIPLWSEGTNSFLKIRLMRRCRVSARTGRCPMLSSSLKTQNSTARR